MDGTEGITVEELRRRERRAVDYIRAKVDQLLSVMGTTPLRPEELDDETLIEIDPIGIVSASFAQVLRHIKETNRELKSARDEIEAIFESAGAGILVLDRDMRIVAFNRRQKEYFAGGEEILGASCCQAMCLEDQPEGGCTFELVMRSRGTVRQRDWQCGGRHFEVVGTPVLEENGQISMVVLAYNDITDLKQAESALLGAKENLEKQNEELKKLDRMKDGLLRDVSHELKTPVAKHLMQLEVLRDLIDSDRVTEKERAAFGIMEEGIRRQENVVHNLLDLSRLEQGGRAYHMKEMRLDDLFARLVKDYGYALDVYGGRINVQVPPISIVCDDEMLWHVFSNILNNSLKFRREDRPVSIDISAAVDGEEVRIAISDNGVGIAAGEEEKILERFYQASTASEGSGVGLAICRRIVSDLGGRINAESEGGDPGMTVNVVLPRGSD